MLHEHSAGSIIYRENDGKIEFLIVESVLHHTWGFPKGHLEKGETEQEAAIREVAEEVGLHPKFDFDFKREIEYLTEENTMKKVDFFLSQFDDRQHVVDQVSEILASKWVTAAEAKKFLKEGRNLNEFLADALVYIEEQN
ncbi:bis(5'-nucleosyl)-tetraphosphatase [Lactobacillus kalixensis]|uniref:Bis(5'-nucleosyl)-tetraphosphatase [asymmetrical] n=1 Tax=Lactobacillus kalixensis DSM 16043 TaxID=1423763 RepID=A0A0R1UEL4_9LACO|nr:NUDIX domain-containing protein [Lactobacillus kalixensis]KRL88043.1 Bis(5-nucleosyl)-tetraphosphatase (asymmetrical) [Lactobacillus kalixensis DSM 16043]